MIDRQIARHFVHYSECLSKSLPFYATQMINPFLNLRILVKHDKGLGYILANREILTPKCRISFIYPLFLTLNNFPIYTIDTILKRNI